MPIDVTLKVEDGGLLHIAPLSPDGVSEAVYSVRPIDGLSHAKCFKVGTKSFLFLLKESNGDVAIYPILEDGGLGPRVFKDDWRSGWTSAEFYTTVEGTFLITLKSSNGKGHINKVNSFGEIESPVVDTMDWSEGWTHVRPFQVRRKPFCLFYKSGEGDMHINEINSDGKIGARVQTSNWDHGFLFGAIPNYWRTILFYEVETNYATGPQRETYILTLKEVFGEVHVNRMEANGEVGPRVMTETWNPGWTHAEAYPAGDANRCFFLKEGTGLVHITEIRNDGTIGARKGDDQWTTGWKVVSSFANNTGPFLVTLKPRAFVPLQRTFVEHMVGPFGGRLYLTDDEGKVRIETLLEDRVDIRVHCQNSVVKVVDGAAMLPLDVWLDRNVRDGDMVTISGGQVDYFRVMNRCLTLYDDLYLQFQFFNELPDPEFPMARADSLNDTKNKNALIRIIYQDQLPQEYAFVDPIGGLSANMPLGWPVIHVKDRYRDTRLFGDFSSNPILIPSEFAHALHFSMLSGTTRTAIAARYSMWLCWDVASGQDGTHDLTKVTDTTVAFVEALDHFSHRFADFIQSVRSGNLTSSRLEQRLKLLGKELGERAEDFQTNVVAGEGVQVVMKFSDREFRTRDVHIDRVFPFVEPDVGGPTLRRAFLTYELSPFAHELSPAGMINQGGGLVASSACQGADIEGAIYGAICLDFAQRVSLRRAMNTVWRSGAVTFADYRAWIDANRSELSADLGEVAEKWGL